ncbi:MAG: SpoIID/LytB domain-containing protein [Acidimicrobiia bacterium]
MSIRRLATALLLLTLIAAATPTAAAQDDPQEPVGFFREVELVPAEGVRFTWEGGVYEGSLIVRGHADGLSLIETASPERYLLGIQEVPYSWHIEALRTQAVAARTYLAWTLARGRAGAARQYGFDICATSACQVYRGLGLLEGGIGDTWAEAVTSTTGEVLLHEGAPALTLYSSTTGGRTSSIEDVYIDRDPVPYLQGVPSGGEPSPFVDWSFLLPQNSMERILDEWGELPGLLEDIEVTTKGVGEGPWTVTLTSDQDSVDMSTWQFRSVMNQLGPDAAPDYLPGPRPEGGRYPQTVLAPTYTIMKQTRYVPTDGPRGLQRMVVYRFRGGGWGHTVGLSQYGALAMAEEGAAYAEILSHYYTGLFPDEAPDALPEEITVGLAWRRDRVTLRPDGPVTVIADGEEIATEALGTWSFRPDRRDVVVQAPVGLGFPLVVRDTAPLIAAAFGEAPVIPFTLSGPAEVRLVVFDGPGVAAEGEWVIREAGNQVIVWDGLAQGKLASPGRYRVLIEARSSEGAAYQLTTVGIGQVRTAP